MIEQKIERACADKLENALSGIGLTVQTMCQLQPQTQKDEEKDNVDIILVVKSSPRSYATATIPTSQVQIDIRLVGRADVDTTGATQLSACDAVMNILENWQKCLNDTHQDFSIENEFACTGYRLDAGAFSSDPSNKIWQYDHTMTVFGVVQ